MRFRAVLFDLDGTLLDTLEDLADSMNAALGRMGFAVYPVAAYRYFVGDGIVNMARRALPEAARDERAVAGLVTAMQEEYGQRWANKTRPYGGVPELLDELAWRGMAMAVLSNKPDEFTKLCVRKLLPHWAFDVVRGAVPHVPRKPDPAAALQIAATLRAEPAEFVYLGDTGTDMMTANAAGMFAVGALWGFRTGAELIANGAAALIERPQDLLGLL